MRLDAKIISEAQRGHPEAIHFLEEYFDSYIAQLSKVTVKDKYGKQSTFVHEGIKEELQSFLLQLIMKFDYERGLKKNEP